MPNLAFSSIYFQTTTSFGKLLEVYAGKKVDQNSHLFTLQRFAKEALSTNMLTDFRTLLKDFTRHHLLIDSEVDCSAQMLDIGKIMMNDLNLTYSQGVFKGNNELLKTHYDTLFIDAFWGKNEVWNMELKGVGFFTVGFLSASKSFSAVNIIFNPENPADWMFVLSENCNDTNYYNRTMTLLSSKEELLKGLSIHGTIKTSENPIRLISNRLPPHVKEKLKCVFIITGNKLKPKFEISTDEVKKLKRKHVITLSKNSIGEFDEILSNLIAVKGYLKVEIIKHCKPYLLYGERCVPADKQFLSQLFDKLNSQSSEPIENAFSTELNGFPVKADVRDAYHSDDYKEYLKFAHAFIDSTKKAFINKHKLLREKSKEALLKGTKDILGDLIKLTEMDVDVLLALQGKASEKSSVTIQNHLFAPPPVTDQPMVTQTTPLEKETQPKNLPTVPIKSP